MSKRIAVVECTVRVEVEVPAGADMDAFRFSIEENGCPGTGSVGAAIYDAIKAGDAAGTCWACPHGTNKIVEIREVP